MPNYMETTKELTEWRRAYRIVIDNSYGETPMVSFVMEDISIDPDGNATHKAAGALEFEVTDNGKMVTMIDMDTNLPTETAYPVGLAQWIIYSLFWELAQTPAAVKTPPEPSIVKAGPALKDASKGDSPTPKAAQGPENG